MNLIFFNDYCVVMMQAPLELVSLGSSSSMDSFASWKMNGVLAWKKEGKVYGIHREKKKLHLSFSKDTHVTQLILKEIRKG